MYISTILCLIPLATAFSTPKQPQHIINNPPSTDDSHALRIPTSYESAVMGRRILALTPLATLSTIFPSSKTLENRPSGLEGMPIGLPDYIANCEETGDPTILSMGIATSFKNVAAGSNISVALQWAPPHPPVSKIGVHNALPYSAANLPRFSLIGYLEKIPEDEISTEQLGKCFTEMHPDAKYWLPGNSIHRSEWVRLVVESVYWIGGFGDRAYIGWIPVEEWKSVTRKEWEAIKLPGEKKGWKEWSIELFEGLC